MKLSIIIPFAGGGELLEDTVVSIQKAFSKGNREIIVVDNGSGLHKDNRPKGVRWIKRKDMVGFAKACNLGAQRAKGEYLFFLNSDVILFEDSISLLIDHLEQQENVGIAGMRLLFPTEEMYQKYGLRPKGNADTVQHVGLSTSFAGELYHQFLNWKSDHPKVMAMYQVLAVTGATLMISREDFIALGGFNENYGLGTYEDVDLCMKMRSKLQKDVVVVTESTGYHFVGSTVERKQVAFNLTGNKYYFMSMWLNKLPWTDWENF